MPRGVYKSDNECGVNDMKKRVLVLILIVMLVLTLTSCQVHVGTKYYDRPWWEVTGISLAIIIPVLIFVGIYRSRCDFVCSECGKRFHPKWYISAITIHNGSRLLLKCPHCGHRGMCDRVKMEKNDG